MVILTVYLKMKSQLAKIPVYQHLLVPKQSIIINPWISLIIIKYSWVIWILLVIRIIMQFMGKE